MRALLLALLCAAPPAMAQPDATGEWWTPGFGARVRIEACGDALCGRISWLWDDKPAGVADRGMLLGKPVLERMAAAGPGRWAGGRLYNPEDGRDYTGSLQLQGPDRLLLEGCVLFVCRTQLWRRFDAHRCPPVAP